MINEQVCIYCLSNWLANSHIDLCNLSWEKAASSLSWPMGRTTSSSRYALFASIATRKVCVKPLDFTNRKPFRPASHLGSFFFVQLATALICPWALSKSLRGRLLLWSVHTKIAAPVRLCSTGVAASDYDLFKGGRVWCFHLTFPLKSMLILIAWPVW